MATKVNVVAVCETIVTVVPVLPPTLANVTRPKLVPVIVIVLPT